MTFPSSGSWTAQLVRDEVRQSGGNIVVPDPLTRWLTEKPTGSIILPTDFYSKRAVKVVGEVHLTGNTTAWSTTIQYGIDYPNRTLVLCLAALASGGSLVQIPNFSLSGQALTGGPGQAWQNPSIAISSGIAYLANPALVTGTSGTMNVITNRNAEVLHAVLYSFPNRGTVIGQNSDGVLSAISAGTTVSCPANSILVQSCLKTDASGNHFNMFGTNEATDGEIGGGTLYGTGRTNRHAASSQSFGFTIGGGTPPGICTTACIAFGD